MVGDHSGHVEGRLDVGDGICWLGERGEVGLVDINFLVQTVPVLTAPERDIGLEERSELMAE